VVLAAVFAGAGTTAAQQASPVTLDPSAARQNTTLVLGADASLLAPGGAPARSLSLSLGRGMRVDPTSRVQLCSRREALAGACPDTSRIGFGRFTVVVRGYAQGNAESELAWAIDAYLGEPGRSGDAGSVVLIGKLLGANLVGALLAPSLNAPVPESTTTFGRLIRHRSGRYAVELSFDKLPAELDVASPVTATPSGLELSLGAVRRVRQNFVRRIKIRTPSGFQVRKVRDHRLVGHYLFRTPGSCSGSWPAQLSVGVGGRVKRTTARIPCTTNPASTAASA
jgi:hypothetical protein